MTSIFTLSCPRMLEPEGIDPERLPSDTVDGAKH